MKKDILLILGILVTLWGMSQVKINPKVGLSLSKLNNTNSNEIHGSYLVGVDVRIGSIINFVPGLYFGNVGTDLSYTDHSVSYNIDNSINTLQLRTLLAINAINTKALKIRVIGGPSLHWTVQSLKIEKDNIQDFISFLNFGAGIDIGLLSLDARYEYGLTNVFDASGSQYIAIDAKENILIFSVGLVF